MLWADARNENEPAGADEALKRLREAIDISCDYSIDRKYGFRIALEAKPNEPRGDIYMADDGRVHGD